MPTRRQALVAAASLPAVLAKGAETVIPPIRYLQIGTGHAHANKISVYEKSPDWEVIGIVEEDPELLALAKKDPVFAGYPFMSLEEGLRAPGLKVVGVETRVRDLLRYAKLAVEAGFHVHLDKPAGDDFDAYREILRSADAKALVVQMGYMYRFNPAVLLLHRMIKAGWLGEIFETHAVMSKIIPASGWKAIAEYRGGTMFELGCHIIDLTVAVLGNPQKVTPHPRQVLRGEVEGVPDNMLAVLDYLKATATVRSTALEVEGSSRRHFTVCGTEGTFHIQPLDRPRVTLSLSKERSFGDGERVYPKGTSEILFDPPYSRYEGDAADLAAIVRGEKENSYPAAHDLAVQETVLAASGMR